MITLGVIIEVPEPFAEELRQARVRIGDPEARTIPPHITLVAPVSVDPSVVDQVEDHLAAACAQVRPFRVHLRGTGTFRPVTPVVFVTVAEGIGGCESLESLIRSGPLSLERHFPFHPHVTVALELPDDRLDAAFAMLQDYDATFDVDAICLYELADDGWVVRRTFALA